MEMNTARVVSACNNELPHVQEYCDANEFSWAQENFDAGG